jgi:cobalt-precorrin-5B (C1)-methyltransferase
VTASSTLRRGWTTGACATAAAKAAYLGWVGEGFPDPVHITLPRGEQPAFALAECGPTAGGAFAGVVKDAGDDPDVTHGALIRAFVSAAPAGQGIVFRAGEGVGTVTRPGLPIPPGEPAINPVPRQMMRAAILAEAQRLGGPSDVMVEIAVPGGALLAERTLNARLGIVGGLSILGTTGVVIPFSCAAWIDSIHRGVDVARAVGSSHIAGATGRTSEQAVQALFGLPEVALIEMGDFVGGLLKYVRRHPVPRLTIAGGVAKIAKLAEGRMDLHSRRGSLDPLALIALAEADTALTARILEAATTEEAVRHAEAVGVPLGARIAQAAWRQADAVLDGAATLDIAIFDRSGTLVATADHGRNRR